uniref:Coatomer subunit zeta n=1 Tax=Callithrix jacchus TaxID=9483 RepID=A0A8I3WZF5_CALJA
MSPCWLIFVFLIEMGFHHIAQAGLELLTSGDLPTSTSQSVGITGMCHHAWLVTPSFLLAYLRPPTLSTFFLPPGEIALLEGLTVVYKSSIDLYFYVIGSSYENELMLMAVLNCLFDSLSQMLRKNVEKRALLENMEGLFLAVDEIVDGGVILESDPQQVVHRVALRGEDVPLTEQTVSQVLQSAKEQIKWSLLR